MANYNVIANATSNTGANTEDRWIEILPPANVSVVLRSIRVSFPHTTVLDVIARVRVARTSDAGATGTAFTPTKTRVASPAAVSTVNIKNTTNAFSVGTVTDQLLDASFNSRGNFEWVARDERHMLESAVNGRIVVFLRINNASVVGTVECTFEE
jgi:hypothetical protein